MGFGMAGLFFLRFWRKSRDLFFALFALAFFVMSANRIGLSLSAYAEGTRGDTCTGYASIAFALILVAVLDKNRSRKSSA